MRFESNAGQTDKRVKFLSHGKGYTLFLTDKAEAVLCLNSPQRTQRGVERRLCARPGVVKHNPSENGGQAATERPPYEHAVKQAVVRMQLVGANPKPEVAGAAELSARSPIHPAKIPHRSRSDLP